MKDKTCKSKTCKKRFTPTRPFQSVCSPLCAIHYVNQQKEAKFKAETRRRKQQLRDGDRKHWLKKAKTACHAFIRTRDRNEPCISCGAKTASQWDAGHYRPSGNNSFLRFNELNIHKQCSRPCNKDRSGNLTEYRINLLKKIGQENLDFLEKSYPTKQWTIDELKDVIEYYTKRLSSLEA